jgi:HNH endonuclease
MTTGSTQQPGLLGSVFICNEGSVGSIPTPGSKYSKGGRIMAFRQRMAALKRYYLNPNYCKECQNVIGVSASEKVWDAKVKLFCSQSCSGKYHNRVNPKPRTSKTWWCPECGERKARHIPICSRCAGKPPSVELEKLVKSDLFGTRKNWQSARSSIQRHARKVYANSDKPKYCALCGYDRYFEVAHLKAVSSFAPDSRIVEEINNINNLVALCPNHHREFDNGLLTSEDFAAGRQVSSLAHNQGSSKEHYLGPQPFTGLGVVNITFPDQCSQRV